MKKVLMLICAVLMSAVFFVGSVNAGPSIDQQFTSGGGSVSINSDNGRFAQIFKPTLSTLSKIEIELTNISSPQTMSIAIRHRVVTTWDEGSVAQVTNQTVSNGWNTFDFEDISVLTGADDSYGIWTTTSSSQIQWKYASISGYNFGYGIWQNTDMPNWDYNFKTWGTSPVEIIDENTQANDNVNTNSTVVPAGQSVGTGAAPAATTSASIKAASGLTALYSNAAANLHWTASTSTDIDGYKIFRSEAEKTGFTEIGKTVKATVEYVDNKDLTAGKTYYYFVRAYKGALESDSTSTVSLLIPEASAANTISTSSVPISTDPVDLTDYRMVQIYWISGWVIAVLIILLTAYEIDRKRKGGFPGARHFRLVK